MKNLVLVFIVFISLSVKGQIVNNISNDKTNMWFHAIDSVTRIIIEVEDLKRIYIRGYDQFPAEINGVKLIFEAERDWVKNKLHKNEAFFLVRGIEIIRDQFKISIFTRGYKGLIGDRNYVFSYQYKPETRTYELREIIRGMIL